MIQPSMGLAGFQYLQGVRLAVEVDLMEVGLSSNGSSKTYPQGVLFKMLKLKYVYLMKL